MTKRVSQIHHVKSWVHLFQAFIRGEKTHDIRVLDRDYQVGDYLHLNEYDAYAKEYTGRSGYALITYITSAQHVACAFSPKVLDRAYGVLSIKPLTTVDEVGEMMEIANPIVKIKNVYPSPVLSPGRPYKGD